MFNISTIPLKDCMYNKFNVYLCMNKNCLILRIGNRNKDSSRSQ
jgi:hypothetical protein